MLRSACMWRGSVTRQSPELLWPRADEGLRMWEERRREGLPPCGPIGVRLLEGACLTPAVAGRLASYGPMSTAAGPGGVAWEGAWRRRGWRGAGRGGRPHQLVGNGL